MSPRDQAPVSGLREASERDAEDIADLINEAYLPAEGFLYDGPRISLEEVRDKLGSGGFLLRETTIGSLEGCVYVEIRGEVGYFGLWQAGFASNASLQILLDLCIACGLGGLWLIGDAKRRGVTAWPWLIAVLALGSIGLLAYLFLREREAVPQPAH